jgi:hypothetical protein
VSLGGDRRARFLAVFAKALSARCECSQPTATERNGGEEGIQAPVQVGTVNFRISAGGEGEARGQRRQSSAASGLFETSIDNRLRTGEKQAMKKDFDAAMGKATRW